MLSKTFTYQAPGLAAAAAVLALALLAGCAVEPQRLSLRDAGSKDADALVTFRPEAWARRGGAGPARGFEAGWQQFKAEGTQVLGTGETLNVRGATLTGPDLLLQNAKVVASHFGFADRFYFGPAFEFDVAVGGMRLEVDYRLRPQSGATGTQPFARADTLPYGAITPRWRFNSFVALEARIATAGLTDNNTHRKYDGALVLSPVPQVSLRLGYSSRRTRVLAYNNSVFSSLDLTIRGNGPMAGLRIDF